MFTTKNTLRKAEQNSVNILCTHEDYSECFSQTSRIKKNKIIYKLNYERFIKWMKTRIYKKIILLKENRKPDFTVAN